VVTVGAIHGGIAPNVIPDSVELQLTVRSFTPEIRDRIKARILAIAEAQAQSFGATTEIFAPPGYPALTNDPAHNAIARNTALRLFGPDRVAALPPLAVSEDFAYFLAHKPGAYLFVGNGASAELHSPPMTSTTRSSAMPPGSGWGSCATSCRGTPGPSEPPP